MSYQTESRETNAIKAAKGIFLGDLVAQCGNEDESVNLPEDGRISLLFLSF